MTVTIDAGEKTAAKVPFCPLQLPYIFRNPDSSQEERLILVPVTLLSK